MDTHVARVFVRDIIFNLTCVTVPLHLWGTLKLSDVGMSAESVGDLSKDLGLNPASVVSTITLEELATLVSRESPLQPEIVRESLLF